MYLNQRIVIIVIVIGVLIMAIPITRRLQLVIHSLSSSSSFSSLSFSSIRRFRTTATTTTTTTTALGSSSSRTSALSLPLPLSSPPLFATAFTLGSTTTAFTSRRSYSPSSASSFSALQVVIPELSSFGGEDNDNEEEQEQDNNMQPPPSFYENHSINNTNKKKNDSSNKKNKDKSKVTEKNNPSAYNSYAVASAATNNNDDYYNNGGGGGYGRNNSYNDNNYTGKDNKEDEEINIMVNPFAFLEESNSDYCDSSSSSSSDNSDSDSDDSDSDGIFSLDQFSDNNADNNNNNTTPPEDGIFTVPGSFSSSSLPVVGIEKKEITDNDEQYATKQHQFSPFTSIMESSSSTTTVPVPVATVIEQQLTTPTPVAATETETTGVATVTEPFEIEIIEQQQQQELIPPITDKSIIIPSIDYNSGDNKFNDIIDSFTKELEDIENEIHIMTSTATSETTSTETSSKLKVNLNSPKQVSQLLFGRPDMSTNKSTLEGMAGSSIIAKLILDYRSIKKKLNKYTKQQQQQQQVQVQQQLQRDDNNNNDKDSTTDQDQIQTATIKPTTTTDVLLFDTSSFIFRAYFSSPPIHRNPDGMPIGAVMGFCSMINKILLNTMLLDYSNSNDSNNKPSPTSQLLSQLQLPIVIQCLDSPGKSFRNDIYPDYKANRPPCPMDLIPQFDLINKACKAYGMIQIQSEGYEADDVIASLATKGIIEKDDVHNNHQNYNVKILSGDKDLMQLVTMENSHSDSDIDDESDINNDNDDIGIIQMLDPMTNKLWTYDKVIERWDINTTSQLGDLLALAGDTADNIPGVPGIGPKIAAQLLKEFGTLENLLNNTDQIPQKKRREKLELNKDKAILSRQLVELKRDLNWSQMQIFYPTDTNTNPTSSTDSITNDNNGNGINNGRHHINNQQPESMVEGTKISELRMEPINVERILAFYEEMNFFKLKKQLLDRIAATTTTTTTATSSNNNKSFSSSSSSSSSASYSNIGGGREEEKNKKNKNDIGGTHSTNVDVTATTSRTAQQSLSSNDDTIVSLTSSTSAVSPSTKTKPKKTTKRNFWEKYKRGIPKPEEYTDVPF